MDRLAAIISLKKRRRECGGRGLDDLRTGRLNAKDSQAAADGAIRLQRQHAIRAAEAGWIAQRREIEAAGLCRGPGNGPRIEGDGGQRGRGVPELQPIARDEVRRGGGIGPGIKAAAESGCRDSRRIDSP